MVKFLPHPDYKANQADWIEYYDLHKGKHETLVSPSYLWMHEFEYSKEKGGNRLRSIRQERSTYTNYLKPVIDRYCSLIFKNDIDTKEVEPLFGDEIKNVDGKGNSLQDFLNKVVAPCYFLYGKAAILTDSYSLETKNRADEIAKGQRPYFELIEPLSMPAWGKAGEGTGFDRYLWVRTEADMLEPWLDPETAPAVSRYSKVYKLEDGRLVIVTYKADSDGTKKATGDIDWQRISEKPINGPNEIPISLIEQESWMKDVAPKAKQLFNLESALDNQLNFQGWQRVFASGPIDQKTDIVVNEAGLVAFPEGTTVNTVEPSNPVALMARINGVTATLFQIAFYRTRILPSDAKAIESSDNQREAKEEFLACVISAANSLENLINDAIRHYATFKGQKDFKGRVKFDTDITIEDWDQVIGSYNSFSSDIRRFDTWYKAAMKKVALQMNLTDTEEILKEIDASNVVQEMNQAAKQQERATAFNEALTGNNAES